jgi:hypothetical protein
MTVVELHSMEPKLGVIEEVECYEGDTLVLRCLVDMKLSLASIKPQNGVTGAIVFWKL